MERVGIFGGRVSHRICLESGVEGCLALQTGKSRVVLLAEVGVAAQALKLIRPRRSCLWSPHRKPRPGPWGLRTAGYIRECKKEKYSLAICEILVSMVQIFKCLMTAQQEHDHITYVLA